MRPDPSFKASGGWF